MKMHSAFRKTRAVIAIVLLTAVAALATGPTSITTQTLVLNTASSVSAGGLAITFGACDATNGNSYAATGREVLIIQNSDTAAHTFTITPTADPYGGTNTNFTTYSVAASSFAAVQMKSLIGWQSGGLINLTCTSALLKYAVIVTQ
jgi:hypothetical protein